jgi:hypothetical protein
MIRPKILPPGDSFKRRLSVFFLFIIVFILFFGIYWYKYIPANQRELNGRGFRILRQLSSNITTRYDVLEKDLENIFDSTCPVGMKGELEKSFINYVIEKIGYEPLDTQCDFRNQGYSNSIILRCGQDFKFFFNFQKNGNGPTINVKKYLKNILESRDDLFESYMLL